jgi:bifunctional polynucleotide phosphatase/kinase
MAPIIYKINSPVFRNKMAAFDYDWTLVNPKNGKKFPTNINDWQYLYDDVPKKLKQYYENNFMIVIFTNQSKLWKCQQIMIVAEDLNIPIFVVISMDKQEYKPNPSIFYDFINKNTINNLKSFFVGDALGRKHDFADSDKKFAENIDIKYFSPEEIFNEPIDIPITIDIMSKISLFNDPEIIIMVGYPGSGKTTIANIICQNKKYILIESDVYKTSKNMIKNSIIHIKNNKSIIFDATNNTIKKRKEYILLADKYNYHIQCIHVTTSIDLSYKRNKQRDDEKQILRIAYSVYTKYYEEPNENEGFKLNLI